jgi:hypothetical protein
MTLTEARTHIDNMSPLRGFGSIPRRPRGWRPWLNYAAAPRLNSG